jgi:uncharacterized protein YchJ
LRFRPDWAIIRDQLLPENNGSMGNISNKLLSGVDEAMIRRYASVVFLVLIAVFVAGCTKGKPEDILQQRVNERWQALIARDYQAAYALETPAFRAAYDLQAFRRRLGGLVEWSQAEVKEVALSDEKDTAQVTVLASYTATTPFGAGDAYENTKPFEEQWIYLEGQWWHAL